MKRTIAQSVLYVVLVGISLFTGCSADEAAMQEIARKEAMKALNEYKASFVPEKFNFGVPWEKDASYSQGVKVGNMIFVAGQLSHSQEPSENWEYDKVTVGESFEVQFRQTLENIKAVLVNYGATMDDVVFLQIFIDPEAGGKKAGNYVSEFRNLIKEYFPNGQQAMTTMQITNLFGKEQFLEANAIAVVSE